MSADSTQATSSVTGFAFGDFELNTQRGSLRRGDQEVKLRPKSFDLLAYMVTHPGRLISKDELLAEIWGATVVTEDAVTQCVIDIRRALCDREQAVLKTVPRRGFIFDIAVTPIGVAAEKSSPPAPAIGLRSGGVGVGLLGLLGLAVLGWQLAGNPDLNVEDVARQAADGRDLSIAVLPLEDMSANQDQAHFAEGISEELLNVLTRVPELEVIARTSSFSFKGQNVDIETIAERLNVTHILEGSVRKSGSRLRITVQLVRAKDSAHLWSQTYDREPDDIFVVQDEISADVVKRLQLSLLPLVTSAKAPDPEAYRLYLQAMHLSNKLDHSNHPEATALLTKALELDPDFGPAWRELARILGRSIDRGPNTERDAVANRAALYKALELSPNDAATQAYLAYHVAEVEGDLVAAARRFEHAIELDPANENVNRAALTFAMAFANPDDAVELAEFGIVRNPICYACLRNLGYALRGAGRLPEAQEALLTAHTLFGKGATEAAKIMLVQGDAENALATFRLAPSESLKNWGAALALTDLGRSADATKAIAIVEGSLDDYEPFMLAQFFAWLGKNDRAFEKLEEAASQARQPINGGYVRKLRTLNALSAKDPIFKKLHNDPRWQQFLDRHTASEEQLATVNFSPTLPTRQ